MPESSAATVTRMLGEWQDGNQNVLSDLFSIVYEELHAQAHRQRKNWQGDFTLNTTALVHEAYLKLVDQTQITWRGRPHFLYVAAKAMRHILIDYARAHQTRKRGGHVKKLSFDEMEAVLREKIVFSDDRAETLIDLDDALQRLEKVSQRESQVVECRFFGGMTVDETAAALCVSPMTVKRDWSMARAWLYRDLLSE